MRRNSQETADLFTFTKEILNEKRQRPSGIFIVNFEHISHLVLVNLEQVNAG